MNNFDQSSSGVNLELNISYDSDLAQMYFDDSFTNLVREGGSLLNENYSRVDTWLYTCHGNLSNDFELYALENYDVKSIKKDLLQDKILGRFFVDMEDANNTSQDYFSKYFKHLTKLELFELVENYDSYSYDDFIVENLTPLFDVITTRGYSQRDYAEIIIPLEYWKTIGVKRTDKALTDLSGYLDQMFWDQPVYARLTIDDTIDFDFMEYTESSYEYNKDQFLAIAEKHLEHKEKPFILGWLADNLTDQPSYDYF